MALPFEYKDELKKTQKATEKKQKELKIRAKKQLLANQIIMAQSPQATQAQMINGTGVANA